MHACMVKMCVWWACACVYGGDVCMVGCVYGGHVHVCMVGMCVSWACVYIFLWPCCPIRAAFL